MSIMSAYMYRWCFVGVSTNRGIPWTQCEHGSGGHQVRCNEIWPSPCVLPPPHAGPPQSSLLLHIRLVSDGGLASPSGPRWHAQQEQHALRRDIHRATGKVRQPRVAGDGRLRRRVHVLRQRWGLVRRRPRKLGRRERQAIEDGHAVHPNRRARVLRRAHTAVERTQHGATHRWNVLRVEMGGSGGCGSCHHHCGVVQRLAHRHADRAGRARR